MVPKRPSSETRTSSLGPAVFLLVCPTHWWRRAGMGSLSSQTRADVSAGDAHLQSG